MHKSSKDYPSTGETFLSFRQHAPRAPQRSFVRNYWALESRQTPIDPIKHRVVPDGCMDIIVFRRCPTSSFQSIVVGTMTRPLFEPLQGRVEYFGVRFIPGGFSQFCDIPACHLTDQVVPLEELDRMSHMARIITDAQSIKDVAKLLEANLLTRNDDKKQSRLLNVASEQLVRTGGIASIKEMAEAVDCSPRHLRRLFYSHVGVSPKMLCRIFRFKNALTVLRDGKRKSLIDVALETGYYDQAHFNREFKHFYGDTPSTIQN